MGNHRGSNMGHVQYMGKARFEKSINSLIGIINGIQADQIVNQQEIEELQEWCLLQNEHIKNYPFKEIIPLIKNSILDGVLTEEEIEDIHWLCNSYVDSNPYYDAITSDITVLHGIVHGILSDGRINEEELKSLMEWLQDNEHLETLYPYDEIYALTYNVMKDGKIDAEEEKLMKAFFADFIDMSSSANLNKGDLDILKKEMNVQGICAFAPNIILNDKCFSFTGTSSKMKRAEIGDLVTSKGGLFNNNVTNETDFLIVGDEGNPCWVFSCYGRKIEKAISLRKKGKQILIVHEVDFWDAIS